MSYNWNGLMELLGGKYRPTWTSLCEGDDVKGLMELDGSKYKPVANAHGLCEELEGIMVNDSGKYFPRIVLEDEFQCCSADDCSACDGVLWDAGETPRQVQVVISGVTEAFCSEADPNGTYVLTQMPDKPCWWYSEPDDNGFLCYYVAWYSSGHSGVALRTDNYWYFIRFNATACQTWSDVGSNIHPNGVCGGWPLDFYGLWRMDSAASGGYASVSWPID